MSTVSTKLELALKAWLSGHAELANLTLYEGHRAGDLTALPRAIITCGQTGGELAYAGIEQCQVEIILLHSLVSTPEDEMPVETLAAYASVVKEALCEDSLPELLQSLNAPDNPADDTRAVKGFGISGLEFSEQAEGRDEGEAQQGIRLNYTAWAHLEPE